ncbi:Hypothetical protein ORPV_260 [Orpheovirus IHUMI-LCC2]|uniref:Uncharacterized protein n=1 Tax=Orpheovirus IHUMI-LCC2 TaxID=2023057 RepID=A0A2I2L3Q8_9VIRU|nr:Hypothetical protein ORPV_260 [Orpheovirus IHUMI-LCC2]SNW62164.1 Hypothetical protein ORPV_260 [Orpheovirus IHUMI-LCC2]
MVEQNFKNKCNDTIGQILLNLLETEVIIDINLLEDKILSVIYNIPCIISVLPKLCKAEQYYIQDIIYKRISVNTLNLYNFQPTEYIDLLYKVNINKIEKGENIGIRKIIKNDDVEQFIDVYDNVDINVIKSYIKEYLPLNILYYISSMENKILPICISEEEVTNYDLCIDILIENNFVVIV